MIAFEGVVRGLVLLHAAAAIVLLGAATHHAIIVGRLIWNPRFNTRLSRIYGATSAVSVAVVVALGALSYPAYRYYTRGLYLDHHAVWASKLFDIKEDLAVLALLFATGVWIVSRYLDGNMPRIHRVAYSLMVWFVALITWFDVFSGLLITMVRGV